MRRSIGFGRVARGTAIGDRPNASLLSLPLRADEYGRLVLDWVSGGFRRVGAG